MGFRFGPTQWDIWVWLKTDSTHYIISHYIIISFSINMVILVLYHGIPHFQTHPKYPTYQMVDYIM